MFLLPSTRVSVISGLPCLCSTAAYTFIAPWFSIRNIRDITCKIAALLSVASSVNSTCNLLQGLLGVHRTMAPLHHQSQRKRACLSEWRCDLQAAKKRDFMTGSTIVHSEVRPSMLSSARLAFTQQYGEPAGMHHDTATTACSEHAGACPNQGVLRQAC